MNPKVNGQLQHYWDWFLAIYLFLGGLGSGAYAITVINTFLGIRDSMINKLLTTVGLWISFPALLIGTLFLTLDLGTPGRAFLAGLKPKTSWISRGFWIISIFMVLSFLHLILHLFSKDAVTTVGTTGGAIITLISVVGIIFAFGTMAYTGLLLGASKGIPFWRAGGEPVVFMFAALATGLFAIILGVTFVSPTGAGLRHMQLLALEAAILLFLELLAIIFFLLEAFHQPDPRESAERILREPMFIIGYFVLGLVVPFILMLIVFFTAPAIGTGATFALTAIGAILGLVGGLILRHSVLICGALPTLNIAGFDFRRIHRPKEPKPAIGLVPPGNVAS